MNFSKTAFTSPGDYVRPCYNASAWGTKPYPVEIGAPHRVVAVEGPLVRLASEDRGQGATFLCASWVRCARPGWNVPCPPSSVELVAELVAHLYVTTEQLALYAEPDHPATLAIIAENRALLDRTRKLLTG